MKYYLAIDIGASSGRHILGFAQNGRICTKEIYRFENALTVKDGALCWDIDRLFSEIKRGMKLCGEMGTVPESVSIDTWGVDFVLLDKNNSLIGNAVSYRDSRTNNADKIISEVIDETKLYALTGIQKQLFNTIYQLAAIKKSDPMQIERAESMLMIPDYFNFLLTGKKLRNILMPLPPN